MKMPAQTGRLFFSIPQQHSLKRLEELVRIANVSRVERSRELGPNRLDDLAGIGIVPSLYQLATETDSRPQLE